MPPRRSRLSRIGWAARRGLRHALHLRTTPGAPRAAAPATLTVVGGLLVAAIASGRADAAGRLTAARHVPSVTSAISATSATTTSGDALANQAEVALALRALTASSDSGTSHRASRSTTRAPLHRWVRPNAGPLSSPFGYRWGRLHEGIDLAGPYGSPIVAATDGCITYAGAEQGYGEVIKITDWDGSQAVYGHMSAFVRRSGCVKAGDVIARVGSAGDATGAHLHFGLYLNGAPINPIPYLAKRGLSI